MTNFMDALRSWAAHAASDSFPIEEFELTANSLGAHIETDGGLI